MIFSKTIALPSGGPVYVDVALPETFTPGSTLRLEIVENGMGHNADWKAVFPLEPGETVKPLYGLFESDGHELDRFLEEKRGEKSL
ncbi:MAG: hypothetical protein LBD86_03785 [Spirochaetaceae bacterium]|jgi:hypothetical protein|nr:hypothetical protein [Spirochaetaceae bacterium]